MPEGKDDEDDSVGLRGGDGREYAWTIISKYSFSLFELKLIFLNGFSPMHFLLGKSVTRYTWLLYIYEYLIHVCIYMCE